MFMGKDKQVLKRLEEHSYLRKLNDFDSSVLMDLSKEDPKEKIYNYLDVIKRTGMQPEHGKNIASRLRYLLKMYDEETIRLKSDIAHDGNVTLIDAYNKGRLAEHESMVEDLLLLLDESFRD